MLQMAEAGVIDFSKANLLDRRWWTRLHLLMIQFERRNIQKLLELQHNQHCAAITYMAGEEVLNHHWDESMKLLSKIQRMIHPWILDDTRTERERAIDTMRKKYVEVFGDPSDPVVQEGIKRTVEELKSR